MSKMMKRVLTLVILAYAFSMTVFAQAQASSADLVGTVVDPNGAVIQGATITVKNAATGFTRTVQTNDSGEYQIIGLPPGDYELTCEATNFKKLVISPIKLTIGQRAELQIKLEPGEVTGGVVTVSGENVELIETSRTAVATTIEQTRIQNLPINERSAIGFALTISTINRDNGRPIGPAPTSGLNIGGQRGRSTLVQVDGVDFTDNSVNTARSTVGQEAVQEYQIATNSYMPEFGRAIGGVVNVVTKRGTNDYKGNLFFFLRDKTIQARPPFAPTSNKPDFTRVQYGATLGGPIVKDKTFFFTAFEGRQRRESGFFTSNVAAGLTASVTVGSQTFAFLTPQQAQFAQTLLSSGNPTLVNAAIQYLYLASSGSYTALNGFNPLVSPGGSSPIPAGQTIGARFFLSGAPVPASTVNSAGEPIAFRPLNQLQRVFPVRDKTHFFSIRGDHAFNLTNQLTLRFSYNPSKISGIQVESQNQALGQNDFSRTGISDTKDYSFSAGLNSNLTTNTLNEIRFSFGQRDTTFRSQINDAVAFNISGTAFIGRELFSPVVRTERRFQIADNFNWIVGKHSFKFGADINYVQIPSARFELNFAGLFNFGPLSAGAFNPAFVSLGAPDFTPVQAYGLGFPSNYIQGFGNPISKIKNRPLAFYAQDSWKIHPRLTLNYGVRYDVELTDTIQPTPFRDPLTGINLSAADLLAAQDVLKVQQGFPRDTNNFAPRLAIAWDVFGTGKTLIRAAAGLFYDHPLLAIAFNSDIADAAQQQQAVLLPGSPSPTAFLNATQVFHGTVCTAATTSPICTSSTSTPGAAATAQYQFGRQRFNDQTFPGFGPVLPFTLPVEKDFKYASAFQTNLTLEQQLTKNITMSIGYIRVAARNLPRPTDLNTPNTALQIQNFVRFAGINPSSRTEVISGIVIPNLAPGSTFTNVYGVTCAVVIPGMIAQCPSGRVISPLIANFFRPNGPNYFLAQAASGGAVTKAVLDSQLAGTLRTPGLISPFGAVNAQISNGFSNYDAMNVEVKRRFADNFLFFATYTWSHAIDDSSDLQTLLIAQDVTREKLEKANSLFDQRHRFVFSGVLSSPQGWFKSDSFMKRFFADFTVSTIVEISSGRPFNIITNVDTNNDLSTQTDRPSVRPDGSLCLPGTPGCTPLITDGKFSIGNLGRNMGITKSFMSLDLRITKAIRFGERIRMDFIAEGFNLFNRFNQAAASPFFEDVNAFGKKSKGGKYFSKPTAAFDQRQFQLGVKLNF